MEPLYKNHLYPENMETIEAILRCIGEVLLDEAYSNVSIICGDGVEVKSNALLLASISPWIYKLLREQCEQEHITLVTPDINSVQVENLMTKIVALFLKKNSIDPYCDSSVLLTLFVPDIKNLENKSFKLPNCCISETIEVKEELLPDSSPAIVKLEESETNEGSNTVPNNKSFENGYDPSDNEGDINDCEMPIDSDSSNSVEQSQKEVDKKNNTIRREKVFKCDQCIKSYVNEKALNSHKLIHGSVGDQYSCNICNKVYVTQKALLLHLGRHNPLYPPSTKVRMTRDEYMNSFPSTKLCNDCGKEFRNTTKAERYKYSTHVFKHKVENFKCDCDVPPFKTLFEKERHMKVVHMGWHQCPKCMKYFEQAHLVDKHILQVHSEQAEVVCEICGHSNSNRQSLYIHMQSVHSGVISTCKECSKEFNGEVNLANHVRNVHRPKQCPHCEQYFKDVRIHINTMHKLDKEKKFQCKNCGKGFGERTALRKHEMNVHIKSRPYNCRYGCDIAYNDTSNRNHHEKKKHGAVYVNIVNQYDTKFSSI